MDRQEIINDISSKYAEIRYWEDYRKIEVPDLWENLSHLLVELRNINKQQDYRKKQLDIDNIA